MNKILSLSAAAAAAILVGACGGGGTPTTSNATSTGAAGSAPILATGTITAFGSVFVNGVHFDTSHAAIQKNGQSVAQSELRVGEIAHVKGSKDDNQTGVADAIDVEDTVVGPIGAIDIVNSTLTVLGQTVKIDGGTSFSADIQPADLTGLKVTDFVEVSGLADASGNIAATRIERKPASGLLQVLGTASGVDTSAHTFKINALTVNYSTATVQDFAGGEPHNGDLVEVHGTAFDSNTVTLTATRIELQKTEKQEAGDDRDMEREGLVTRFMSATDFDVAGEPVTTNGSTVYRNGTVADLALNVKVEVEGSLNSSNVLLASVVSFQHNGGVDLQAPVSAVDAAAATVTVLGVKIAVNSSTRLEDKSSVHIEKFSLGDVKVGDVVEVRAIESPAGSGQLTATRLERRQPTAEIDVRGPFTAGTAPQFTIEGIAIDASGATFHGSGGGNTTVTTFLAQAVGHTVEVSGILNGSTVIAAQIHLDSSGDSGGDSDD